MFQDVFNVFHIRLNSKKITGGCYFKTKVILSRKGCISKKLNKKVSYFLRMVGCSDAYQYSSKLQLGPSRDTSRRSDYPISSPKMYPINTEWFIISDLCLVYRASVLKNTLQRSSPVDFRRILGKKKKDTLNKFWASLLKTEQFRQLRSKNFKS